MSEATTTLARIAREVERDGEIDEPLARCLRLLCEACGCPIGAVVFVGSGSVCPPIWHGAEDPRHAALRASLASGAAATGVGAAARGQARDTLLVCSDLRTADWPAAEVARAAGLRARVGVPVRSAGEVAAIIELLAAEPFAPNDETRSLLSIASALVGRLLDRSQHRRPEPLQADDRRLQLRREREAREAAEAQADELRRVTRELERSNRELDQFAYVTSHDLKAPLRGIANLSQWLEDDLDGRLDDDNRRSLELMRGRVQRMEALIDGILAYARVGRRRAPEQVDVHELLAEILDDLDAPPGRLVIAPNMPVVIAERVRLRQVFANLLDNALSHAGDGARIEVSAVERGSFFEFAVIDDGPGIDRPYQDKVWKIFQTLQPRDRLEGTGIGLALVKKIVETRGGVVSLDSRPGEGATFRFRWPKREGEAGLGHQAEHPPRRG